MDDQKLIVGATSLVSDILKAIVGNGVAGIVGLFFVYYKWIEPWRKKGREDWVSWRDVKVMKEKQIEMEKRQDAHEVLVNGHLLKEAEEDIRMAKMEVKLEAVDDKIKTENAHIFGQLKSIHEAISDMMKHYGGTE